MSNPIKFLASHNSLQKVYFGDGFYAHELYLFCDNDIIVDAENYYHIHVNLYGTNNIVERDILESIIWKEREKKIDYITDLSSYFDLPNEFVVMQGGFLEFNIVETGTPTGLENAYWYLDQWKKRIIVL